MTMLPDLHAAEPIPDTARAEIEALLFSGDLFRYTHPETSPVTRLEAAFAAHLGVPYVLAVSSCSAAMFLALKALDLPQDAPVLTPAFTFSAVPSAVVHAGLRPVLVEIDDGYRMELADLRTKIRGAGAILLSHMRGHISDLDGIRAIAEAEAVPLIEDAAHALGATWSGQPVGTLGRMGCFSFQSYKLMNAGEGGLIVTQDPELYAKVVIMSGAYERNWAVHPGVRERFEHWQTQLPLYNMRMSNLSAAVLAPQVDAIATRGLRGRRNHEILAEQVGRSPWVSVPEALPQVQRAPDSFQFNLVGLSDSDVDRLNTAFKTHGLGVQIFGRSEGNARAFWNWNYLDDRPDLPKTRAVLSRACDLRLPTRLTEAEVTTIADVFLTALGEAMGEAPPRAFGT